MTTDSDPGFPFRTLVAALRRLPGLSQRQAAQLATQLVRGNAPRALALARLITEATEPPRICTRCHVLSLTDPCAICANPIRERHILRIVEESLDLFALESREDYRGLYYVLGGVLSPLDGIGPADLFIAELLRRVRDQQSALTEIRVATRDDIPGNAMAIYLWKELQSLVPAIVREHPALPPRP